MQEKFSIIRVKAEDADEITQSVEDRLLTEFLLLLIAVRFLLLLEEHGLDKAIELSCEVRFVEELKSLCEVKSI